MLLLWLRWIYLFITDSRWQTPKGEFYIWQSQTKLQTHVSFMFNLYGSWKPDHVVPFDQGLEIIYKCPSTEYQLCNKPCALMACSVLTICPLAPMCTFLSLWENHQIKLWWRSMCLWAYWVPVFTPSIFLPSGQRNYRPRMLKVWLFFPIKYLLV